MAVLSFLQVLANVLGLPVASQLHCFVERVLNEDTDLARVPRCGGFVADLNWRLLEVNKRGEGPLCRLSNH